MLAGRVLTVLVVINFLWFVVNAAWTTLNNGRLTVTRKLLNEAADIRDQAINDAVLIRANEFKVCKTCGKIVQGVCEKCSSSVSV